MQPHAPATNRFANLASGCFLALVLAGTTIAGIQGTGFRRVAALGVITSVGNITVNGTAYASDAAQVSVDGNGADTSQLHVGQVVRIDGSVSADGAGIADEIAYVADVRGSITAVDPQARTFAVLGQTVRVTDETLVDDHVFTAWPSALAVGALTEVSGFTDSAGQFVASRVDVLEHASTLQVRGPIQALDTHAHTFRINTLLVDYENAEVEGVLSERAIAVAQGDSANGLLRAQHVGVSAGLGVPGATGDLEGIVTSFASAADFEINGQRVVADEKTHFKLHGMTLGPDVPAYVTGRFDDAGTLVADKVDLKVKGAKTKDKAAKAAGKNKP
jgi:hypothetical protein